MKQDKSKKHAGKAQPDVEDEGVIGATPVPGQPAPLLRDLDEAGKRDPDLPDRLRIWSDGLQTPEPGDGSGRHDERQGGSRDHRRR